MIEQYTPVKVQVKTETSDREQAVVIFATGERNNLDVPRELLDESSVEALDALLSAGAVSPAVCDIAQQIVAAKTARRLVVIGLGPTKKVSIQSYREAGGQVGKLARKHELSRVAVVIDPALPLGSHDAAAAVAGGICTGFFSFDKFKGRGQAAKKAKSPAIEVDLIVDAPAAEYAVASVGRAVEIAIAQNFARAIAAHPGNVMHPLALAQVAGDVARHCGLTLRTLNEKEMHKLGMGGMLAVGGGSPLTPPRMIVLEWKGSGSRALGSGREAATQRSRIDRKDVKAQPRALHPLLLVGKAITFDTGGISIKPREGMERMVYDKCGAMAVIGAMIAIARLRLPQRVIGILAAAENHVSDRAYRPGDILTMYNGVTVEVTNTDAEGRLVLADALAWGIETYKPSAVVDLATLTGGIVVALGREFAGLFCDDDPLAGEIASAAQRAGEKTWRMPFGEAVRDMMKSEHADIVNSAGRWAHPIQGAEFLRRFVPDDGTTPWAHLDIAGVADSDKASNQYSPGATGWGVRTLVQWVLGRP